MAGQFGMLGRIFGAVPKTPANFGASMLNAGLRGPYHQHQYLGIAQAMRSNPAYGFPAAFKAGVAMAPFISHQELASRTGGMNPSQIEDFLTTSGHLKGMEHLGRVATKIRKTGGRAFRSNFPDFEALTRPVAKPTSVMGGLGQAIRKSGSVGRQFTVGAMATVEPRPKLEYPMVPYTPPVIPRAPEQPGVLLGHHPMVPYKPQWASRGRALGEYTGSAWKKGITKWGKIAGGGMIAMGAYKMWRSDGDEGFGTALAGAGMMYGARPLGGAIGKAITTNQIAQRAESGAGMALGAGGASARMGGALRSARSSWGKTFGGLMKSIRAIK
jgi:hypothetical protein